MTAHLVVPLHDQGPALWPDVVPESELAQMRRLLGTPIFNTMYQAKKGGLSGQIIRDSFFRYYEAVPTDSVCFAAVDLAISKKETSDERAIAVGNVSRFGDLYLRFVWSGRPGISALADVIKRVWDYYKPVSIGVEDVAFQAAMLEYVTERYPDLPIEPVNPGGRDKLTRHLGLAALYEFGRVYHHPSLKATATEWQLTHLPGRHDDIADAIQYLTVLGGIANSGVIIGPRPDRRR
jgi:phage terminase large subunit-like protein